MLGRSLLDGADVAGDGCDDGSPSRVREGDAALRVADPVPDLGMELCRVVRRDDGDPARCRELAAVTLRVVPKVDCFLVSAYTAVPGAPAGPWQGVQYLSYHRRPASAWTLSKSSAARMLRGAPSSAMASAVDAQAAIPNRPEHEGLLSHRC